MAINGIGLAAIGAGSIFLYAGIKGYSIPKTIQYIVQGKSPTTQPQANAIAGTTGATFLGTPGVNASALPSSGSYTHSQLEQLWIQNGGSPATANNAACHAVQESSGSPTVTSSNPDGGTNVGLWQLDTPGGKGAGYSVAELQNAPNNARIAVMASRNGTDWSAWATPGC